MGCCCNKYRTEQEVECRLDWIVWRSKATTDDQKKKFILAVFVLDYALFDSLPRPQPAGCLYIFLVSSRHDLRVFRYSRWASTRQWEIRRNQHVLQVDWRGRPRPFRLVSLVQRSRSLLEVEGDQIQKVNTQLHLCID